MCPHPFHRYGMFSEFYIFRGSGADFPIQSTEGYEAMAFRRMSDLINHLYCYKLELLQKLLYCAVPSTFWISTFFPFSNQSQTLAEELIQNRIHMAMIGQDTLRKAMSTMTSQVNNGNQISLPSYTKLPSR